MIELQNDGHLAKDFIHLHRNFTEVIFIFNLSQSMFCLIAFIIFKSEV